MKKVAKAATHPVVAIAKDASHVAKAEAKIAKSLVKVRNLSPLNLTRAVVKAGVSEGKLAANQLKFAAKLATSPIRSIVPAKKRTVTSARQFRGTAIARVNVALNPPPGSVTPGTTPSAMADALRTAAAMSNAIAGTGTGPGASASITGDAAQAGPATASFLMNPQGSQPAFSNTAPFASQSFSADDYADSPDPSVPISPSTVGADEDAVLPLSDDSTQEDPKGASASDVDATLNPMGSASNMDANSDPDSTLPMSSGDGSDSYDMTPQYLPPGQQHRELGVEDDDDTLSLNGLGGTMTGYEQYMSHLNGTGLGSFWDTVEGDVSKAATGDFAQALGKNLAVTALNTTANAIKGKVTHLSPRFKPHPPMAMGTKLIIAAAIGVPVLLFATRRK